MNKSHTINKIKKSLGFGLVFVLLISTLTGCTPNPKNFSSPKITITLDESFKEYSFPEYELCIKSDDVIFRVTEHTTQQLELSGYEILSLSDYADEILKLDGSTAAKLQQRDDYYYFISSITVDGANYSCVNCMLEGDNAFWLCQFIFKSKDHKRLAEDVFSWADSIVIVK